MWNKNHHGKGHKKADIWYVAFFQKCILIHNPWDFPKGFPEGVKAKNGERVKANCD